jgi:hypothetical protein
MLFLFVSVWGVDDSALILHLFCEDQDGKNEVLDSFSSRGVYFHFQMANMPCFLIVDAKLGIFFSSENEGLKMGRFPNF